MSDYLDNEDSNEDFDIDRNEQSSEIRDLIEKFITTIILGGIIAFVGINFDRAIKRLKMTYAEKLEAYHKLKDEIILKLLDESLTDIEKQRLEKGQKKLDKKIISLGKKEA